MNNENTVLLNEVINDRLEVAYKLDSSDDDYNRQPLEDALKAIDKMNSIDKNELDLEKIKLEIEAKNKVEMEKINLERERIKLENETKNKVEMEKIRIEGEKIKLEREKNCDVINIENDKLVIDSLLKVLEIGVALVAVPMIDNKFKTRFAEMICSFEKDYNFTTTAGRSLSSLFKFR